MDGDRILATYLVETPHPVEHAVEVLAGEQSSGTITRDPGESEELQERFRARVERIHELNFTALRKGGNRWLPHTGYF